MTEPYRTSRAYYKACARLSNSPAQPFGATHKAWLKIFATMLAAIDDSMGERTVKCLYFGFQMQNWEILHKENTKYRNYTQEEFLAEFKSEVLYICDRLSLDRIFRTHWLFRQAYAEDLAELEREGLYSNNASR